MAKVLIIIPAYNESENIKAVVDHLIHDCPHYDYVVVNDGSRDDTARICRQHQYNLIDLPVNLGLAGGFQAGMKYASYYQYDYAVQFDADGQHDTRYIDDLLSRAQIQKERADIVIGSRFVKERKPVSMRMVGSRVISACIWITTRKKIADPTSGMRLYNKRAIKRLAAEINYEPEPDTIAYLIRCGYKVEEVPVTMHARTAGESYLNLTNSLKYMIHMCSSILIVQWFRGKGESCRKN